MEIESSQAAPAVPEKSEKKESGGLRETTRFLLFLFIAAVLLRSFIAAPFSIPSGSMLPRMMIGDYLFVAKWPYGYSRYSLPFAIGGFEGRFFEAAPERGDVVVFRYPGPGNEDFVKRVIGLPGDTIQMIDGVLSINGEPLPKVRIADYLMPLSPNTPCRTIDPSAKKVVEDEQGRRFCAFPRYRETLPGGRSYYVLDQTMGSGDNTEPVVVPEGHYFVMGDNRDDSFDSRFPVAVGGVGLLPAENLIGRALLTFFSTDGSADYLKPWTWFSAARWDRIGKAY
ncbi:MAG TPA: signal peptidase I [Allosphingosinicella sp.]|nr:signal peptidase I [Allosphingosinicella sp.]